jgi:hypothetical protein
MNIGRRLKEERNLKGLSQQQLADAVGIKQSAISQRKVYAVCLPHEGLVLKRLTYEYIEAAGTSVWMMKSDNPDKNQHPDRRLPPDESTIIVGRAVWYGNRL